MQIYVGANVFIGCFLRHVMQLDTDVCGYLRTVITSHPSRTQTKQPNDLPRSTSRRSRLSSGALMFFQTTYCRLTCFPGMVKPVLRTYFTKSYLDGRYIPSTLHRASASVCSVCIRHRYASQLKQEHTCLHSSFFCSLYFADFP